MNEVLYHLCRHCVSVMDSQYPFPSTLLSKVTGMSLYKTRKELKKLKEQEYVVSTRYWETTEDGTIILNGYGITTKAHETEEYKKAYAEEREACKKIFGFDIGERREYDNRTSTETS